MTSGGSAARRNDSKHKITKKGTFLSPLGPSFPWFRSVHHIRVISVIRGSA
jgi:hypothetical protein